MAKRLNCKEYNVKIKTKLFITVLGLAGLFFIIFFSASGDEKTYEYSEEYVQTKELPAMLSFYYYTKDEWKEKMEEAEMGEVVTTDTIAWILDQTSSAEYITYDTQEDTERSVFSFRNQEAKTLTREEWNGIYGQLLDLLDEEVSVKKEEAVILNQDGNTIVCASGVYTCELEDPVLEDMTSPEFYIKEDKIIGISRLKSKSAVLSNVYVQSAENEKITFLFHKGQYELKIGTKDAETPSDPKEDQTFLTGGDGKEIRDRVCDLVWEDGVISKIQVKEDTIKGNLIAVNETTIEIEGYGEIRRSENFPVYKTYGTTEEKELSDIVIANMKAEYVVARDCIEAVLLTEPAQISRIRVLLLTEDGKKCHDEIRVSASEPYRIITKDGKKNRKAKSVAKASKLLASTEGSVRIKTKSKNGMLYLCDADGKYISNGYTGTIELRKYPEGYAVVNELPIEQYLCAVVPSEMPVSYELEALKAQAVCARSYAYIQLEHGDYAEFGAHVDDTTNYQVYNKQNRDEKTNAAVLDTAGQVIRYQGETAEAYYFSTSAGVTDDGEAWGLDADPGYGYLKKGLVKEGGGEIDLSNEETFEAFISVPDPSAYEKDKPFFRWTAAADFSSKETQSKIKEILNAKKARTPENISFINQNGEETDSMRGFGALLKISIAKRNKSGIILQLQLDYENGTALAGNEYNVRSLLGAGVTELTLSDKSKREPGLLPSAYTTLVLQEDGTYRMNGGGYGHGIGMSQNGAQAMALNGKKCEEILKFFFKDIEIENGDVK